MKTKKPSAIIYGWDKKGTFPLTSEIYHEENLYDEVIVHSLENSNNLFVYKDSTTFLSNSQAISRIWDFGDNSIKVNDSIASHTYVNPGIYKVSLIIRNYHLRKTH